MITIAAHPTINLSPPTGFRSGSNRPVIGRFSVHQQSQPVGPIVVTVIINEEMLADDIKTHLFRSHHFSFDLFIRRRMILRQINILIGNIPSIDRSHQQDGVVV